MFLSEGTLEHCQSALTRRFCVISLRAKEGIEKGHECFLEDFVVKEFQAAV